jgi:hypothetical protein
MSGARSYSTRGLPGETMGHAEWWISHARANGMEDIRNAPVVPQPIAHRLGDAEVRGAQAAKDPLVPVTTAYVGNGSSISIPQCPVLRQARDGMGWGVHMPFVDADQGAIGPEADGEDCVTKVVPVDDERAAAHRTHKGRDGEGRDRRRVLQPPKGRQGDSNTANKKKIAN